MFYKVYPGFKILLAIVFGLRDVTVMALVMSNIISSNSSGSYTFLLLVPPFSLLLAFGSSKLTSIN